MSVQIIYQDYVLPISPTDLSWPSMYINGSGQAVRMPNPSMPIKYGYKANNLVLEFESGHEQRRQKGMIRKTFEFTYKAIPQQAAKSIENFFLQCRGSVKAFNWTDPCDGETYKVRFDDDSFGREYIGHSAAGPIFQIVVKLQQVL